MQMNIPKGYKQTEVGLIPENWVVKKLGDIGKFKNGINKGKEDFGFGYPFVNLLDIFGRTKLSNNLSLGLVNSTQQERKDYELKQGDVLFVRSSVKPEGVGLTAVVIEDLDDSVYSGFIIRFRDFNLLNLSYKEYCFYEEKFRKRLIDNSTVSANTNINQDALKNLALAFPPTVAEQKAIAQSLSDVDALITECDRILIKKRNTKQGTMQQLLTGKKRLPGFSGKWEVKKLGMVAPLQRGFDLPTSRLIKGNYPVVYSNGILNFHNKYQAKAPGVVTGRSGTIGKVTFVEADYWPHNTSLWVTDFKENSPKFIYYLYIFIGLERFGTGSGVPTLNRNDVHAFQIPIPPTQEEQKAIAQVLSDMDTEIAALEQKRDKYKAIKQGMMQELLTGKTRLISSS